jgi:ABC-type antimicrobial peptide transport system permease subunit
MGYVTTRRTQEIGVRLALGASQSEALRLILKQGLRLVVVGVALGLVSAIIVTRAMKTMLFGLSSTDPVTYVVLTLLLTAVALLACYLPARRAMKVDPLIALRQE